MNKYSYHEHLHHNLNDNDETNGGYFASATDLLVGFLFIFIILIGISRASLEATEQQWSQQMQEISQQAEQLATQKEQLSQHVAALTDTSETRTHILHLIETEMKQQNGE